MKIEVLKRPHNDFNIRVTSGQFSVKVYALGAKPANTKTPPTITWEGKIDSRLGAAELFYYVMGEAMKLCEFITEYGWKEGYVKMQERIKIMGNDG